MPDPERQHNKFAGFGVILRNIIPAHPVRYGREIVAGTHCGPLQQILVTDAAERQQRGIIADVEAKRCDAGILLQIDRNLHNFAGIAFDRIHGDLSGLDDFLCDFHTAVFHSERHAFERNIEGGMLVHGHSDRGEAGFCGFERAEMQGDERAGLGVILGCNIVPAHPVGNGGHIGVDGHCGSLEEGNIIHAQQLQGIGVIGYIEPHGGNAGIILDGDGEEHVFAGGGCLRCDADPRSPLCR